mgnify:CR=1 FL=1
MLTVRIKIGEGNILDSISGYGLVYISADHRFGADVKDFDVTTYPEQEGENINPKTVDAPFDYKVKFYIKAEGALENANQKITAFNQALYTQDASGVKTFQQVYFYNDYKKVLIVGYPKPIPLATQFWRDSSGESHDVVVVEWVIRVNKPSLCNFNL